MEALKEGTSKQTALLLSLDSTISLLPEQYRANVNLQAGVEFLQKHEKNMSNLHEKNRYIFNIADATDKQIRPVAQYCRIQNELWNGLHNQLASLPDMVENIAKLSSEIGIVCERIEKLEELLNEQMTTASNLEVQNFLQTQVSITQRLKQQKDQDISSFEDELKIAKFRQESHQMEVEKLMIKERLREQEILAKEKERSDRIREQELMLERERARAIFDESFKKDVEAYKNRGEMPKKRKSRRRTKNIEEVVLEGDRSKLEEFLGPKDESESTLQQDEEENDEDPIKVDTTEESPEQPTTVTQEK